MRLGPAIFMALTICLGGFAQASPKADIEAEKRAIKSVSKQVRQARKSLQRAKRSRRKAAAKLRVKAARMLGNAYIAIEGLSNHEKVQALRNEIIADFESLSGSKAVIQAQDTQRAKAIDFVVGGDFDQAIDAFADMRTLAPLDTDLKAVHQVLVERVGQ